MPDRKLQSKFVFRFRPPAEPIQSERDETSVLTRNMPEAQPQESSQMNIVEMQQGARQIKELLRLSNLLRVEQGLNEVLPQVATSIANSTGFRTLIMNIIREQSVCPVAFAGVSEEDQRILQNGRDSV